MVTTNLNLAPKLSTSRAITLLTLHVLMVWTGNVFIFCIKKILSTYKIDFRVYVMTVVGVRYEHSSSTVTYNLNRDAPQFTGFLAIFRKKLTLLMLN
jgi:hypothetical protein